MTVVDHVIASITPASRAHADAARRAVAGAGAPVLERLAAALGGGQHTARPRATRKVVVVCAADHPAADPGVALGAAHPTVVAAHAIADGSAALATLARTAGASIVLVDAGVAEPAAMPPIAIRVDPSAGAAAPTAGAAPPASAFVEAKIAPTAAAAPPASAFVEAGISTTPASAFVEAGISTTTAAPPPASAFVEAGIALGIALADDGLDVLALGALGLGAELAAAAVLGGLVGAPAPPLRDPEAQLAAVRAAGRHAAPLDVLAHAHAPQLAVLAGLVLVAASIHVPVVLDGHASGAAAAVAAALAPDVRGYLVAPHAGDDLHRALLSHLGLTPVFEVGLGHGEGTGAAVVLPLLEQVAALSRTTSE